jgi:hypothetical protein
MNKLSFNPMKIKHIMCLFLLCSNIAFSEEMKQFSYPDNIPSELKFILSSGFTPDSLTSEIMGAISLIDAAIGNISDEELSLIIKIEVIRGLLTYFGQETTVLSNLYNYDLKKMKLKAGQFATGSLASWVCNAIITDFESVISNSGLRGLILARKQGQKNILPQLLKLEKKAQLIGPWAQRLNDLEIEELNILLNEAKINSIKKITPKLTILMRERGHNIPKYIDVASLKHFKTIVFVPTAPTKSVEEILDDKVEKNNSLPVAPVENVPQIDMQAFEDIPETSKEDNKTTTSTWIPPELPANQNLPKNWPKADEKYVSPKRLPDPVNDWIMDL